jgi:outer membrane PBP1 activator LpoA protein
MPSQENKPIEAFDSFEQLFQRAEEPAFVTRLVSGHNNFTIATMVRVARALDCEFRCHLQPAGTKACWLDVLKEEPQRPAAAWAPTQFHTIQTLQLDFAHETVPIAT